MMKHLRILLEGLTSMAIFFGVVLVFIGVTALIFGAIAFKPLIFGPISLLFIAYFLGRQDLK